MLIVMGHLSDKPLLHFQPVTLQLVHQVENCQPIVIGMDFRHVGSAVDIKSTHKCAQLHSHRGETWERCWRGSVTRARTESSSSVLRSDKLQTCGKWNAVVDVHTYVN